MRQAIAQITGLASGLGAYKIVSKIVRGGTGLVFKGHRDDAKFNKDVAIKLVRDSGHQARLIDRFKAERQILATLDHPRFSIKKY